MNEGLEELFQKRSMWVKSSQENNFEEGIKRLLTELYPDNAHFIYELLQNAEDTKATHVKFTLESSRLIFEHNGKRLFNLDDVDSITSIGVSTKRDDPTSIGKFGVGFKAVFAYTNTPEIHSGNYHFAIHDLVVPTPVASDKTNGGTKFIFPFDHARKLSSQAVSEILAGLNALGDNTLLFLSNIQSIEYKILSEPSGTINRSENNDGHIEIHTSRPNGNKAISRWLRFQKEVDVIDDDGIAINCRIAIAYSLVEGEDRKNKNPWRIAPLEHGQVSIYFPAEKETSNLRFHMHAPFASTVARDSVRTCTANDSLRDRLSELVVESLGEIRELGLLTITSLAVFPNPNDNLPDFYEPIRTSIVDAFQNNPLTPMRAGGHEAARGIFSGPVRISEVINDDDLVALLNESDYFPPMWVANPPPQHQRVEHFIESLEIEEWEWYELAEALTHNFGKGIVADADLWLLNKSDEWMQRFYALLDTLLQEQLQYASNKNNWRIVRTATGNHVKGREAFFPDEQNITDKQFPRVKSEIFKGNSKRQIERATNFLTQIGVTVVGEKQEIESLLKEFYSFASNSLTEKLHLQHMARFIGLWNEHRSADFFKNYYLFKDSDGVFSKPVSLFIDKPYKDTGLKDFYLELDVDIADIWDGYSKLKDIYAFAVALGVVDKIEIVKTSIYRNPDWTTKLYASGKRTSYETKDDYTINDIETYLKKAKNSISLLIWRTVSNAPTDVLRARYCPNYQSPYKYADSQLVHYLKNNAWIPGTDGKFYRPINISQEMLLPEFRNLYLNTNGWLDAIGFGGNVRRQTEEYLRQKEYAERLGIPLAITELLKKLPDDKKMEFCEKFQSEIESFLNPPSVPDLPSSPAPNPERREEKSKESAKEATDKEYESKNRSVRTTNSPERKTYLKAHHSNDDGHVYCQLCDCRMPFSIKGEDYFEAVEFARSSSKEHPENSLALCPNCAAEYKHACLTPENERIDLLLDIDINLPEDNMLIPLDMPNHTSLRFTQKHLIDLRAAMLLHKENGETEADAHDDEDQQEADILTKSISQPAEVPKTSPIVQNPPDTQQPPASIFKTNIADKRIERAIDGVSILTYDDNRQAIAKISEIISRLCSHHEFESLLRADGIHLSIIKQATDHLVPGLNLKRFGFSKYAELIKHVCNQSTTAALRSISPTEIRLIRRPTKPLVPQSGPSLYGSTSINQQKAESAGNSIYQTSRKSFSTRVKCRFCDGFAMPGSDVCYSCGA